MGQEQPTSNLDFNTLSERIAAQTEAYLEFSRALIKIIEELAQINNEIQSSDESNVDSFKDVFQRLISIGEQLKFYIDLRQDQESILQNEIEEYNRVLQHLGDEIEKFKGQAISMNHDLTVKLDSQNEKLHSTIGGALNDLKLLANKLEVISNTALEESKSNNEKLNKIIAHTENINKARVGLHQWWQKFRWLIAGITIAIVVGQALIQFNVIHIDVFPKSDKPPISQKIR